MFPAPRTEDAGCSLPQFALTPCDVDGFLDALQAFHDQCRGCGARSEPREHVFHSMVGQGRALERQAMEPLARHVDGGTRRGMQRCMSAAMWEEDPRRETSHGLVADEMGDPQGVLLVEEAGVVKKGRASVGVARPSCGTLGKVAKRQGGGAPPRPRGRALHWWTNDFVSPHRGGAPPTPRDGTRARCPTRRPCPPSPSGPPRGCVPSGATAASPARPWWRIGSLASVRPAGTPLMPGSGGPRWWPFPPRRVGGASAPCPRRHPRRTKARDAPKACAPRSRRRRSRWRPGRRAAHPRAGIAGWSRKAPKARARRRGPAHGERWARMGSPTGPGGSDASAPWARVRRRLPPSARPLRARRCASACGAVAYGGPWHKVVRQRTPHGAWPTRKDARTPAGLTIC